MKKYACLDTNNVVTQIAELDISKKEYIEDVEDTPGIYPIPSVGQVWNGLTQTFN
jgi:hypothetical protein